VYTVALCLLNRTTDTIQGTDGHMLASPAHRTKLFNSPLWYPPILLIFLIQFNPLKQSGY